MQTLDRREESVIKKTAMRDATVALVRLSINPPTGMQTAWPIRAAA